jgi:hypothetical protein
VTRTGTWGDTQGHPGWYWMILVSLLLHGLGAIAVVAIERNMPRRSIDPSVISVRLVGAVPGASMAQSSPAGGQSAPAQSKPAQLEDRRATPAKVPIPVPQAERKAVSIQPTEVKVPDRAQPAPRVEPRQDSAPKASQAGKGSAQSGGEVGPKVAAAQPGGGGGGKLTPEEARYLQMLQDRIEESWRAYVPTEEGGVLGEVRIQISGDGRIKEFVFVKGSGKSHVDSSIVSALTKVTLPPPPASIADKPLVLRFWPSGPKSP